MRHRGWMGIVATAVLSATSLAACDLARSTAEDSATRDGPLSGVRIEGGSGDVTLSAGADDRTEVRRTVEYINERPGNDSYRYEGNTLVLNTQCGFNCTIRYHVTVPKAAKVVAKGRSGNLDATGLAGVTAEVSSGDVNLKDIAGAVVVQASSGNIVIDKVGGEVTARTGSGDVTGRGVRSDSVLETKSGSVTLGLVAAANVKVHAKKGSVNLTVPKGAFKIITNTDKGSVDSSISNDPNARHSLDVSTDKGDIVIRGT